MNSERYYQASGSAPVVGLIITLVVGMVGGAILAPIYSALVFYNPYFYLNVLAGLGFAAACGALSRWGLTLGKVRNRMLAGCAGAAVGFISMYFAWLVFLYLWSNKFFGRGAVVLDVNDMWQAIVAVGQIGTWSFKEGQDAFKGWGLYTLWAVEAVMVMGVSAVMAYAKDTPFCENCNQWCDEHECPVTFRWPEDLEGLLAKLEADDYSPLYESAQLSPDADVFLKAKLYPCPDCDDTCWLKLEQVVASLNDKGEVETQEHTLVNYLDIPRADYDRLMALVPGSDALPEQQEAEASDVVPPSDEA